MGNKLRIAIVGGGIGGLTLALALRQRGFEPDVYEQASELTEIGALLHSRPTPLGSCGGSAFSTR